jgi:hypothetical protein
VLNPGPSARNGAIRLGLQWLGWKGAHDSAPHDFTHNMAIRDLLYIGLSSDTLLSDLACTSPRGHLHRVHISSLLLIGLISRRALGPPRLGLGVHWGA